MGKRFGAPRGRGGCQVRLKQEPPIRIAQPCTADWNAMSGDARRRLCAQCDKHVHNLSGMRPAELQRFIQQRNGTECIAYILRADGTMIMEPSASLTSCVRTAR
jgi:hypothetical protein